MAEFGDLVAHEMPNGTVVYYRDSDHSYWTGVKQKAGKWSGSGRLTGVSTVVSPFDFRPDNLMRWAARQNGEGVAQLAADGLSQDDPDDIRTSLSWLTTGESIWTALADARLLYSDRSDAAAQRGTNVHEYALHHLAKGERVPAMDRMSPTERGYAHGVMKFWLEHDPEPLQYEQVVCSLTHGVAGRFDLRAKLHGPWQGDGLRGAVCLLDAKTSGFIPTKHHVQLAGYDECAIESGFGASDLKLILQVDESGGYELIEATATRQNFADAVRVYREAARINRESGKARKAATETLAA